jgi:hypothetical protein
MKTKMADCQTIKGVNNDDLQMQTNETGIQLGNLTFIIGLKNEISTFKGTLKKKHSDKISELNKVEIQYSSNYTKEKQSLRNLLIENQFKFIEEDLEIRIESLKLSLDSQKEVLAKKLKRLQTNFKAENLFDLAKTIKKTLSTDLDTYKHANFINTNVKNTAERIRALHKSYLFKCKTEMMSKKLVGRLTGIGLNLISLQSTEPKRIELDNIYVTDICSFDNDHMFMVNQESNQILMFDRYLNVKQRIFEINNVPLNSACSVCTDSTDRIFICEKFNNRVIVTDRSIKEIKCLIQDPEHIKLPIYIEYFRKSVYVLNENTYSLLEYKADGKFVRKINLILPSENIDFEKFHVFTTKIVFLSRKHGLFVFDLDGNCLNIDKSSDLQNTYKTTDDYLVVIKMSSTLSFYDMNDSKMNSIFNCQYKSRSAALNVACVDNFLYVYYRWSDTVNFDSHVMLFEC